jgi:hypothetical protein
VVCRVIDSEVDHVRVLALSAAAFACLLIAITTLAAPQDAPASGLYLEPSDDYLLGGIARHRREAWHWQRVMGKPRTPASSAVRRSRNPGYRRWVLRLWAARATRLRKLAAHPPRRRAWLCIQRHEGPWNDPNPPYYGGLQMDLRFQRQYGRYLFRRKGTADRWSPLEQMWVAERAFRHGRGFYPWPNTARACGLI